MEGPARPGRPSDQLRRFLVGEAGADGMKALDQVLRREMRVATSRNGTWNQAIRFATYSIVGASGRQREAIDCWRSSRESWPSLSATQRPPAAPEAIGMPVATRYQHLRFTCHSRRRRTTAASV